MTANCVDAPSRPALRTASPHLSPCYAAVYKILCSISN